MGSKIKAKAISLYKIKKENDVDIKDEADSVSNSIRNGVGGGRGGGGGEAGSCSDVSSDPESLSSSSAVSLKSSSAVSRSIPAGYLCCAWCQKVELAKEFTFKTPSGNKVFCSEQCFTQCRRASFKRNKTCDWCRHVRHTVNYVDFQDGDHQLQFCSDKCLNQYKMNIFCKETQAHLELHSQIKNDDDANKSETGVSGTLITPEMWMRDCRSQSPDSDKSATPPRIPSPMIEIKISRSPSPEKMQRLPPRKKISRMKRLCRDGERASMRSKEQRLPLNHTFRVTADPNCHRYPPQITSIHIPRLLQEQTRLHAAPNRKPIPSTVSASVGIPPPLLPLHHHRPIPPPLPTLLPPSILPPPTTIVPYPIFIPIPIPLPIPIPIPLLGLKLSHLPQNDKQQKTPSSPPIVQETNNNLQSESPPPPDKTTKSSVTLRRRKRLLVEAVPESETSSKPKIVHV